MLARIRNSGLIVIGTLLSVVMLGLAALLALSLVIGGVALAAALIGPLRKNLNRLGREAFGGQVIEGKWTVFDTRDRGMRERR